MLRFCTTEPPSQGVSWRFLQEGRIHVVKAPRVRVRDTTGAGDVLHGAFAAGLGQGWEVLPALRVAVREASRSCTTLGGLGRLIRKQQATERS